jgi:cold shock CspA family protein
MFYKYIIQTKSQFGNMSDNSNSKSSVIYTGRVKWFNNKAGYGFISITDTAKAVTGVDAPDVVKSGTDIFVHYSKISLANSQYSYLIQGEYVQFQLEFFETGVHTIQASNVTGINGGKLMCETRREFRIARNSYRDQNESPTQDQEAQTPPGPPRLNRTSTANQIPRAPLRSSGRGGVGRGEGRGSGRGNSGRGRGRPRNPNTTQPNTAQA